MTSHSELLGGTPDYHLRKNCSTYVNYEGRADLSPICLALRGDIPPGCLPVNYRTFLTDTPDREVTLKADTRDPKQGKRLMWELQFQTLGYIIFDESFHRDQPLPQRLPNCIQEFKRDQF